MSALCPHSGIRRLPAAALLSVLLASSLPAQSVRPGSDVDVTEATISDLRAMLEQGRRTSVQLVDAYLARIAAYDANGPQLNAMIRLNPAARTDAPSPFIEQKTK